jgi:hypothetical protein
MNFDDDDYSFFKYFLTVSIFIFPKELNVYANFVAYVLVIL